jgi:hypothetical protein
MTALSNFYKQTSGFWLDSCSCCRNLGIVWISTCNPRKWLIHVQNPLLVILYFSCTPNIISLRKYRAFYRFLLFLNSISGPTFLYFDCFGWYCKNVHNQFLYCNICNHVQCAAGILWMWIRLYTPHLSCKAYLRHRLPTVAARAQAQVRLCKNCGGQSSTETGFLRVFRFSLTSMPLITGAGTVGHLVASVIVDSVPLHPKKQQKKTCTLCQPVFNLPYVGPVQIHVVSIPLASRVFSSFLSCLNILFKYCII